jgi:poly(A) polymerase
MLPINPSALQIVRRLRSAGHEAYFAGGWVRDFLRGHPSSDIDIATSAMPEEVQALFEKTLPIGAQFGVVLVIQNGAPIEVTTFRKDSDYQDHRHPSHVEYASVKEDAFRRDFTVNGMYYDPLREQVLDFVSGQEDLKNQVLRAIGDPLQRFEEDRLRLLRGIRFAEVLQFQLDPATKAAMATVAKKGFGGVSPERIAQEFAKMHQKGRFHDALVRMEEIGMLTQLLPDRELPLPPPIDPDIPLAMHLATLFRNQPPSRWDQLADDLRLSREEHRMLETLSIARDLMSNAQVDRHAWAQFMARPWAEEAIACICEGGWPCQHPPETLTALIENLKPHVLRIQMRQPLVTATHLAQRGVSPGPQMGELLKQAEHIAITQDLQEPEAILKLLPLPKPSQENPS